MRKFVLLAGLVFATACNDGTDAMSPLPEGARFSVGGGNGSVYTMSNSVAGNAVISYRRGPDGVLTYDGQYATGGTGTGAGLGNQGALQISADGRYLFVVNAGSNDVTVFRRSAHGTLTSIDQEPSNGATPVSVTNRGRLMFVLNAGSGTIAGFEQSPHGDLTPIPGSVQSVSQAGAGAAQISFSDDGRHLVVTERLTNRILTFAVAQDGSTSPATVTSSTGAVPFGFGFAGRNRFVVSNATAGAPGGGTVSSYQVNGNGALDVLSGTVPDFQTAPCWIAISQDARFAYTTNAASRTISGFSIDAAGRLALLDPSGVTASTTGGPTDVAVSKNGPQFLYVLNSGAGAIDVFRIRADGSLESVPGVAGMPAGANGIAAF